jgi:signal transduction histidine kinase
MPAEQGERVILADIVARLDALNRIVEDMLVFARPRPLRQEPIALSLLVRDTAAMIRCDPGLAGLDIRVEGSAAVIGDCELLQIVFQNILVNAAQAMGGQGRIDVTMSEHGGLCEIAFADRGPGIPLDVREKAFDAFYTTKHRGTGLGLPIARRVVDAHGGSMRVETPASGGTTVFIQLPSSS